MATLEQWEALMVGYELPTLADLVDRPAWMKDALCREHPEIDWFPGRGEDGRPAKALCARCLVQAECLAYAETITVPMPPTGIWGGTSERERRQVRQTAA